MSINETIPLFDLPVDFLVDDNIRGNILELYKMFPCQIKAGIFALCIEGEIKVTLNLHEYTVKKNDFVIIIPGSFIQIHSAGSQARVAFMGFSSNFIHAMNYWKYMTDHLSIALIHPIIPLPESNAAFFLDTFSLLTKAANGQIQLFNKQIISSIMDIFYNALKIIYENTFSDFKEDKKKRPREYEVLKEFLQLVFENYKQEHKVSFYANEIGLTLSHFCATIKKATGKTAQDIIREFIIMDAKAQLKNGTDKINKIAKSLGFSATAFNRFFLEYAKMTPLEYRNS
ncbi:MAG: AraC family transcriptional regulator [Bacteroidetes bacterium]|uniref:AraC family transcriptional regulator n=1 Tax=Candidatus Egerieousia excrementavium TaxID=2840778 RepID=A0A9D9DMT3_9BACT|nr:AraC family transcriptional regulator [Candidatus Egerieousia excrementavium]